MVFERIDCQNHLSLLFAVFSAEIYHYMYNTGPNFKVKWNVCIILSNQILISLRKSCISYIVQYYMFIARLIQQTPLWECICFAHIAIHDFIPDCPGAIRCKKPWIIWTVAEWIGCKFDLSHCQCRIEFVVTDSLLGMSSLVTLKTFLLNDSDVVPFKIV